MSLKVNNLFFILMLCLSWGDENYFEIGLKIHLNFCSAERFQVSAWVPRAKALALPVYALQIEALLGLRFARGTL
jgi:hypothetical protein